MSRLKRIASVARRLMARKGALLSVVFLTAISGAAIFADFLPLDAFSQDLVSALEPPSPAHWFGTDELGRDIMSRAIYGARTSLLTAAGAVGIAAAIGIPIGLVAGFFGGWRDAVLDARRGCASRIARHSLRHGDDRGHWQKSGGGADRRRRHGDSSFARVTRAQVLSLRKRDFVTAVEAFGGTSSYNMFHTILPNSWSPIFVQVVVLASVAILLEAALAFLGVGIPPPTPSWGEMLRTGKSFLHEAPYYAVLPGLVLTLTILSFNSIGRALTGLLEGGQDVVVELKVERAKP